MHLQPGEQLLRAYPTFERATRGPVTPDSLPATADTGAWVPSGKPSLDYDLLYYSVKTNPNRKLLVVKPYLMIYNAGLSLQKNEYKFEKIYKWFFPRSTVLDSLADFMINTAGEKPQLIDSVLLQKDAENLRSVYFSQGYFHAEVKYDVVPCEQCLDSNQARVVFSVIENEAWVIDTVVWRVKDAEMGSLLQAADSSCLLKAGDLYNEGKLTAERARIGSFLRNSGYFQFKPAMVEYDLDTLQLHQGDTPPADARITHFRRLRLTITIAQPQTVFHVRHLTFLVEPSHLKITDVPLPFRPDQLTPELRKEYGIPSNLIADSLHLMLKIYERSMHDLNVNQIARRFAVKEGNLFRVDDERQTLKRLQDLGVFRFTLFDYEVIDSIGAVDVTLKAQMTERFQFKAGIEGFSQNDQSLRTNLPGLGGNLSFRDKMLFKAGEKLDLSTTGNLSFLYIREENVWRTFWELGAKASLSVPKLMLPFMGRRNLTQLSPATNFAVNYNSQNRSLYDRTILGVNWNYSLFHNKHNTRSRSSISPYLINFIQSHLDPAFRAEINAITNPFLRSFTTLDFQPRFSSRFNYKYTWSDYTSTRAHSTHFIQPQFEFGGNTPYLIDRFFKPDNSYADGRIDSIYYGQYFKMSFEAKNYHPINRKAEFVWRVFAGGAAPWNFSRQVPFDSRFFAGGTNSLRGWASNTLGPGVWKRSDELNTNDPTANFLISPGGEVSFEANAEFRMNVYKYIELAIFTDAGNVWFLPTSDFAFESGRLSPTNFYQLGWDVGLGLRFDFSFFIFRLDVAQQLYAPDLEDFVVKSLIKDLGGDRYQLNFGIGYPF